MGLSVSVQLNTVEPRTQVHKFLWWDWLYKGGCYVGVMLHYVSFMHGSSITMSCRC